MIQSIKWEDVGISNDFMFAKVMRDESICKKLLETLLSIKIAKVDFLEEQKNIDIAKGAKSVRLDVYVEDSNRVFNIEMQTTNSGNLAKRTRYYQGIIDLNTIEKGQPYQMLKESYVIFICTFDPFGKGRSRYTFDNTCQEDKELVLDDGAHKIFFNATAYAKETDTDSKSFLQYVNGENVENTFVEQIERKVKAAKSNEEWGVEYMTLLAREQERFFEGREQGLEQGRELGIKRAIAMLKSLNVPDETIEQQLMEQYSFSQEVAKKHLAEF